MATSVNASNTDNGCSERDSMDQAERDNWVKIAAELENSGVTEGGFYQRAKAIADGKPDPGMTMSPAMGTAADEPN